MPRTAGIIIIGDEVLSGKVTDTNSPFLCKRFQALGVKVKRISTISDDIDTIAQEVATFSANYDVVVTTGGIGPTHDDVTYEGIAKAFQLDLTVNAEIKRFFANYLAAGDSYALRLVTIPVSSEVVFAELDKPLFGFDPRFPVLKTRNVYTFPGIPAYVQETFVAIEDTHFRNANSMFFSRVIYLNLDEICYLPELNSVVSEFKDGVSFGSYPKVDSGSPYEAKITIESESMEKCLAAESALLNKILPSWVVYLNPKVPDFELIYRLSRMETELSKKLQKSFEIIEESFSKFNLSEMFLSYNGGKDCTVMLNLICCYCALNKNSNPLTLVYFEDKEHGFPEINEFIEQVRDNYNVQLVRSTTPMKSSLHEFLQKNSDKKVSFIGVRTNDPTSKDLSHIQETDGDWPKLLRIFPILHWSYTDVWNFIRCANIPYCSLYNKGYTSLGSTQDSAVNSSLRIVDKNGTEHYKPAFLLSEEKEERIGR